MADQVKVKVISLVGKIASVRYGDKTFVISRSYVEGAKVGQSLQVPIEAISTGTEHGIDWKVIIPDGIVISPEDVQNALYAQGIFTLEDIDKNPNGVASAVGSVVRKTAAELFKTVHKVIGGT